MKGQTIKVTTKVAAAILTASTVVGAMSPAVHACEKTPENETNIYENLEVTDGNEASEESIGALMDALNEVEEAVVEAGSSESVNLFASDFQLGFDMAADVSRESEINLDEVVVVGGEVVNENTEETSTTEEASSTEEEAKAPEETKVSEEAKASKETKTSEEAKASEETKTSEETKEETKKEDDTFATIVKAGNIAKDMIVEVKDVDFSDPHEATLQIFKKTVGVLNDQFVKNIPYVGDILHGIVKDQMAEKKVEKKDPMLARLDIISEQLSTINQSIRDSAAKIVNQQEQSNLKDDLTAVENAAKDLMNYYSNDNVKMARTLDNLDGDEKYRGYDEIEKTFTDIYQSERNENKYLDSYMKFVNLALNNNLVTSDMGKYDALDNYDKVLTAGETDATKYKYASQRQAFVDNLDEFIANGYSVLSLAMETDLAKNMNLSEALKYQRSLLLEKYGDAATEMSEYQALNNKILACDKNIDVTNGRIRNLNEVKTKADNRFIAQRDDIAKSDEYNTTNEVKDTSVSVEGIYFNTQDVDGVKAKPVWNSATREVEYFDRYDNRVASQHVSEMRAIDLSKEDLKIGKYYKLNTNEYDHSVNFLDTAIRRNADHSRVVKVYKIYDAENAYKTNNSWSNLWKYITGSKVRRYCYDVISGSTNTNRTDKTDLEKAWEIPVAEMVKYHKGVQVK